MDTNSWKVKAPPSEGTASKFASFGEAEKFFAVDVSYSTQGLPLAAEEESLRGLQSTASDEVCKWASHCNTPVLVSSVGRDYFKANGGTEPARILQSPEAVRAIKNMDVWVLMTDGDIYNEDVECLTSLADEESIFQIPVILLIVGPRRKSPERENISVGISFFTGARDALIIYKDVKVGCIWVIDAKGVFAPLRKDDGADLTSWQNLPYFKDERELTSRCEELAIRFNQDRSMREHKGVSLGPLWDSYSDSALVRINDLLNAQLTDSDLRAILDEETFKQLALTCKTRGQLDRLRSFLLRHKKEQVAVRLEDRHGAAEILAQLQTASGMEKGKLTEQLRKAHAENREAYQHLLSHPTAEMQSVRELNRLVDHNFRTLSDLQKSSYTANILNRKSNRAMRAGQVSTADAELKLSYIDLSEHVKAFRSACSICCGENEIMSIALKNLDGAEENTTDFALNFPLAAAYSARNLDLISAQTICFQCACLLERSIYKEEIACCLPMVEYAGVNQDYIVLHLYTALTSGLTTGASGVIQLFTAILDHTLESKAWCRPDPGDGEAEARRRGFRWMLYHLLLSCQCRETFNETGNWVKYPDALKWALKDFQDSGLDSWIIQYPIIGFKQIMRWYEILDLDVDRDLVKAVRQAKLIHFVTARIMDERFKNTENEKGWTQPFLECIYKAFHGPGVPIDHGHESFVSNEDFWSRLAQATGCDKGNVRSFLTLYTNADEQVKRRVQMVIFWAIYIQKGHTTPKTFFHTMITNEPLALVALNTQAECPKQAIEERLLSIFWQSDRSDQTFKSHNTDAVIPFVSPYGASVLHCGLPACGMRFYEDADVGKDTFKDIIREGRARHLRDVYGASPSFSSQTGLPEMTTAPAEPSAHHTTLHVSTTRAWQQLQDSQRLDLLSAIENSSRSHEGSNPIIDDFVARVRTEICTASHRGNIYYRAIDEDIRAVLPSFAQALKQASRVLGLEDGSGATFQHERAQNTIVWKMEYELRLKAEEDADRMDLS